MATFFPRMNEDERLADRQNPLVQGSGIGGVTSPQIPSGNGAVTVPAPTPTPTPTSTPSTGGIGGAITPPPTTAAPATTKTPTAAKPRPTTSGFDTAGNYTPQNDNVIDAVNQVVTSNSPLMQRAQGIGMAVANERGLQNSTLAAQSAEKAMLDAAVPIASQQAQQTYGKNLEAMQADSNMSIAQVQTAAQTQSAFAAAMLSASQSYQANVSAIMQNPDLSAAARQAALDSAAKQRDADLQMMQKVYGVNVSAPRTGTSATDSTSGITANDNLTWGAFPSGTAA